MTNGANSLSISASSLDSETGAVTSEHFGFSFRFSAAKRLRFDLKERQWLSEMENGVRGHLKTFVH
jgi:hypothetical protein